MIMKHSFLLFFFTPLELSSCKWTLVYMFTLFCDIYDVINQCKKCKIQKKKRLMQCYCGTDTSSTMDIHWLLETRGETRCLAWVSCSVVYPNLPWMPATQLTSYGNYRSTAIIESLHENNWNRTNVILKFSRACTGHCLVLFKKG